MSRWRVIRQKYKAAAAQLTRGERFFVNVWMVMSLVLPTGSALLAIFGRGAVRVVGVVLLFVALILLAVPISPILKARIRRRERG